MIGGDASTGGLPVSGEKVQKFIKDSLNSKAGDFYLDSANNKYLVFADSEERSKYLSDPVTYANSYICKFDDPGYIKSLVSSHTHSFSSLTSKPTTLSGYGITDKVLKTYVYTSSSTSLNNLISSGVYYLPYDVTYTPPTTGSTYHNDKHIHMLVIENDKSDNNHIAQIAIGENMFIRHKSTTWSSWRTIIDSSNYTFYVPGIDGTGAKGTWNIDISRDSAGITPNYHKDATTIGELKTSIKHDMTNIRAMGEPLQGYYHIGCYIDELVSGWSDNSTSIGHSSASKNVSFLRIDAAANSYNGNFLVSGINSSDNKMDLYKLSIRTSTWYGPYLILDESNCSTYCLSTLNGGTVDGKVTFNNDIIFNKSVKFEKNAFFSSTFLRKNRFYLGDSSTNFIDAAADSILCISASGNTGKIDNAAINIKGMNVYVGGHLTGEYALNIKGVAYTTVGFKSSGYIDCANLNCTNINGKGYISTGSYIKAIGAITSGAEVKGNTVSATGAVSGGSIYTKGVVSAGSVTSTGSIKTTDASVGIESAGYITAKGCITADNIKITNKTTGIDCAGNAFIKNL